MGRWSFNKLNRSLFLRKKLPLRNDFDFILQMIWFWFDCGGQKSAIIDFDLIWVFGKPQSLILIWLCCCAKWFDLIGTRKTIDWNRPVTYFRNTKTDNFATGRRRAPRGGRTVELVLRQVLESRALPAELLLRGVIWRRRGTNRKPSSLHTPSKLAFGVNSVPKKIIVKSLRQKVNMKKSYFGFLNMKFDEQPFISQNENWRIVFRFYISQYLSFASIRKIREIHNFGEIWGKSEVSFENNEICWETLGEKTR